MRKKKVKLIQTIEPYLPFGSAEFNLKLNRDIIHILEQIWRQLFLYSYKYTKIKYSEEMSTSLLSKITYLTSLYSFKKNTLTIDIPVSKKEKMEREDLRSVFVPFILELISG